MLFLKHEHSVRKRFFFFFFAVKTPHSKQSWLIHPSSLQPGKMILSAAQEHLGMFSTNVITAWGSSELFKEPLLSSLSSIPDDVMVLCGVAETPQINCHSWPFLSVFFFFSLSPFAQFCLSPPALLFIQWFITKVSFISWSSSPPPPPTAPSALGDTLWEMHAHV